MGVSLHYQIRNMKELLIKYKDLKQEVLDFFGALRFNEEFHKYEAEEVPLKSVSHTLKNYVEEFDANKIAGFVARKMGVTKQEVLDMWEAKKNAACDKGTKVHFFGENFLEHNLEPSNPYEEAIVKFNNSLPKHIIPLFVELRMFSKELKVAGTSDLVLYNIKTGKFIIADYKTNVDLFKNYKGKKMLTPFGRLLDNPYNKYQLQLSLYHYLFELTGYKVEARWLIWLLPTGEFKLYKTNNYIKSILKSLGK